MQIRYIDEAVVRWLLLPEEALEIVEQDFCERPAIPPVLPKVRLLRMDLHERYGQVLLVKSCALPDLEVAGVRVFGSGARFIVLMDIKTLKTLAWVDDNWLYQLRTAAEGTVAMKRLAKPGPVILGLIGAGVLARPFLHLASKVAQLTEVRVTSRTTASRTALAQEMGAALGVPIRAVDTVEEAVRGASVIATLTTATAPLVRAEWVKAGALIVSMGNSQELAPEVFQRADKVIADDWETCKNLGDIAVAIREGFMAEADFYGEMGEVFRGDKPGREGPREVILVVPQGMITQDVLLAHHVYRKALAERMGTVWRTESTV